MKLFSFKRNIFSMYAQTYFVTLSITAGKSKLINSFNYQFTYKIKLLKKQY